MGSLFSSNKDPTPPTHHSTYFTYTASTSVQNQQPVRTLPKPTSQYNNASTAYSHTLSGTVRTTSPPSTLHSSHIPSFRVVERPRVVQSVVSKFPLMPTVYDEPEASEWDTNSLPFGKSYRLVNVSASEDDFSVVKRAFQNGAKGKNFKVVKIERVENPFLLGCYLLKKEEMEKRSHHMREEMHFHGTKKCNANNICENNFNWRLYGDSTGSRYGRGVSFSPISFYASHYSDKNDTNKIMFYVKVLVSKSILGSENMVLPPKLHNFGNSRYDTAQKQDGHVIVKFSDNEFYPEFIIHYSTPGPIRQTKPQHYVNYNIYDSDDDYLCYDSDY